MIPPIFSLQKFVDCFFLYLWFSEKKINSAKTFQSIILSLSKIVFLLQPVKCQIYANLQLLLKFSLAKKKLKESKIHCMYTIKILCFDD